jgi:hypothetical protein
MTAVKSFMIQGKNINVTNCFYFITNDGKIIRVVVTAKFFALIYMQKSKAGLCRVLLNGLALGPGLELSD